MDKFLTIKALMILLATASVSLNFVLVSRLQSITESDISYVLSPDDGLVWELETHAEFIEWLGSDSWLPNWLQAPIRSETKDSLVLVGHITPITKNCDWRRYEQHNKLQRSCFRRYNIEDAESRTIIFESKKEFPKNFVNHPVVSVVSERIAAEGKADDRPKLLMPIVMTEFGPVSSLERSNPEPKAAVMFRGWAARNFEVASGMVSPRPMSDSR
jgi:hypothetical protein